MGGACPRRRPPPQPAAAQLRPAPALLSAPRLDGLRRPPDPTPGQAGGDGAAPRTRPGALVMAPAGWRGNGPKVSGEPGPAPRPHLGGRPVPKAAPGGVCRAGAGCVRLVILTPSRIKYWGGRPLQLVRPLGRWPPLPGRPQPCRVVFPPPRRRFLPKREVLLSVGYDVPEMAQRHPFGPVFVLFCWLILYTNTAERLSCFCNMLQFASWLNVSYYLRPSCF